MRPAVRLWKGCAPVVAAREVREFTTRAADGATRAHWAVERDEREDVAHLAQTVAVEVGVVEVRLGGPAWPLVVSPEK